MTKYVLPSLSFCGIEIGLTPEGEILVDTTGRMNGRGAYVCNKKECMEKLMKNHALDKAFKMQVPNEFFENALKELFSD